ncbi:MAG TPA: energy transducer TonB [Terriglobales bacterium]|nr:energy transducer TonB [Terriglobales bacterium]
MFLLLGALLPGQDSPPKPCGTSHTDTADKLTNRELSLIVRPVKQVFLVGEPVMLRIELRNVGERSLFVSNYLWPEFVVINLTRGTKKIPPRWCGDSIIRSQSYGIDSFTVLKPGASVVREINIACSELEGHPGYVLPAGWYRGLAEYSMFPREYFAPAAGSVVIPEGVTKARTFAFSITPQASTESLDLEHQIAATTNDVAHCRPKIVKKGSFPTRVNFRPGEKSSGRLPLIEFNILSSGRVVNAQLKQSSGFIEIDRAALNWISTTTFNERESCDVTEAQIAVSVHWQ